MLKNADLMEFCNFLKIAGKVNNGGGKLTDFVFYSQRWKPDKKFWGWSGFRICLKFDSGSGF
jgi:hypothetical protein